MSSADNATNDPPDSFGIEEGKGVFAIQRSGAPQLVLTEYGESGTADHGTVALGYRRCWDFDAHDSTGQDAAGYWQVGDYVIGVVADGVSTGFNGNLASDRVVKNLVRGLVERRSDPPDSVTMDQRWLPGIEHLIHEDVQSYVPRADLSEASRHLLETRRGEDPSQAVFGAFVFDTRKRVAHCWLVGDAAVYVFQREGVAADGSLKPVTLPEDSGALNGITIGQIVAEPNGRVSSHSRSRHYLEYHVYEDVVAIAVQSDGMIADWGAWLGGLSDRESLKGALDNEAWRDDISFVAAISDDCREQVEGRGIYQPGQKSSAPRETILNAPPLFQRLFGDRPAETGTPRNTLNLGASGSYMRDILPGHRKPESVIPPRPSASLNDTPSDSEADGSDPDDDSGEEGNGGGIDEPPDDSDGSGSGGQSVLGAPEWPSPLGASRPIGGNDVAAASNPVTEMPASGEALKAASTRKPSHLGGAQTASGRPTSVPWRNGAVGTSISVADASAIPDRMIVPGVIEFNGWKIKSRNETSLGENQFDLVPSQSSGLPVEIGDIHGLFTRWYQAMGEAFEENDILGVRVHFPRPHRRYQFFPRALRPKTRLSQYFVSLVPKIQYTLDRDSSPRVTVTVRRDGKPVEHHLIMEEGEAEGRR